MRGKKRFWEFPVGFGPFGPKNGPLFDRFGVLKLKCVFKKASFRYFLKNLNHKMALVGTQVWFRSGPRVGT
jgi:hypothetical protein